LSKNKIHDYNELADSYDETRYSSESHDFIDSFRERAFVELLRPTKDMSIIDVGTGTGSGILFFADKVREIVGLDGTQKMLDLAQKKIDEISLKNVKLVCSNALEIPYEENSFDHVISLNFIHLFAPEGLSQQKKFISEMERVIKPGGSVIIEFDNSLYLKELGNNYHDLMLFAGNMKIDRVVGTYLPKTLFLSKYSKALARLYGGLAMYPFIKPFAYKWVVKFIKLN